MLQVFISHFLDKQYLAMIDEAISLCLTARKPVYLEIACNLTVQEVYQPVHMSFNRMNRRTSIKNTSDPLTLSHAIHDINKAISFSTKPVIIGGCKLKHYKDSDIFLNFVNEIGCGIALTPDAKGVFAEDHKNYLGHYWAGVSSPNVQEIVESADLIICVGVVFNDYLTVGWTALIPKDKTIMIDCFSADIYGRYYPNSNLVDVLPALKVDSKKNTSLINFARYTTPSTSIDISPSDDLLTMKYIQGSLQNELTSNTSILVETGDSWYELIL